MVQIFFPPLRYLTFKANRIGGRCPTKLPSGIFCTQRYEDFRLQLQPVLGERSVRMAAFHRSIAELKAKMADIQRAIAEEEFRMAEFKAASMEHSSQLEDDYYQFTTDMCQRKLQLKKWFEKEHERLREEQK